MSIRVTAVAAISLVAASAALAGEFAITTADGTGADTVIQGGSFADINFGGESIIFAKDSGLSFSRKALLRFDFSHRPDTFYADAAITLTIASFGSSWPDPAIGHDFALVGLNDGSPGEDWGELVTTWNTAPANITTDGADLAANTTPLGEFTVPVTAAVGDRFTLRSAELTGFINADTDGLVTIYLIDAIGNISSAVFASKEHQSILPPELSLEPRDCGAADLSPTFGLLDLADINAFVSGFVGQDPVADLDPDGLFDLADINAFVVAFVGGCS